MDHLLTLEGNLVFVQNNEQTNAGPVVANLTTMESEAEPEISTFVTTKISFLENEKKTNSEEEKKNNFEEEKEKNSEEKKISENEKKILENEKKNNLEEEKTNSEDATDQLYQPVLDEALDDEATLEDEEKNGDSDEEELDELERLGEVPLEELLRMYGGGAAREKTPPQSTLQLETTEFVAGPSGIFLENRSETTVLDTSVLSAAANDEEDWTTSSDEEGNFFEEEENEEKKILLKFLKKIEKGENGEEEEGDGDEGDEEEEDEEFLPQHLVVLKREVPVGPNRQVEPPKVVGGYEEATGEFVDEVLQWTPRIPETEVIEYLKAAYLQECELLKKEIPAEQLTQTDVADDEEFLKELLDCNFEKDEALRRCRRNFRPGRYESSKWSEKECEDFEKSIMENWKRFHIVQSAVPTRTVKEVVEFYYRWKKSNRFEPFLTRVKSTTDEKSANFHLEEKVKLRLNGKKRPLDAMDAVAEDQLADSEKATPLEPRPKSARLDSINSASSSGSTFFLLEKTVEIQILPQGGPSGSGGGS